MLKVAFTQARFPEFLKSKEVESKWATHPSLGGFTSAVHDRLQAAKNLSKVGIGAATNPFEWLVSDSSYEVSHKVKEKAIRSICLLALEEASPDVLDARTRFLSTYEATSLRRRLWLSINVELTSNLRTVTGKPREFSFWDRIPDSLQTSGVGGDVYSEDVAVEVGRCFEEDTKDLNALGNFLTTCRALVNNRDAPASERVVDEKTKALIDQLVEVEVLKHSCCKPADNQTLRSIPG